MTLISLNAEINSNVFNYSGGRYNGKLLSINVTNLKEGQTKAIVGFHFFIGTDQSSSFFVKGKVRCWKIDQDYLSTYFNLRKEFEMTDDLTKELEEYISYLFGGKTLDVTAPRNEIFWKTLKNKKQVIDLFHLPPWWSSLKLHARRCNYIAKIWR